MSKDRGPLHPRVGPAILNPGTGPVLNAELGHAEANIRALIADAAVEGATAEHVAGWDSEGRFHFDVTGLPWFDSGARPCSTHMDNAYEGST